MKFAKLSLVLAAASILSAPAFAATAPATYTQDIITKVCASKKDPKACESRRKVGAPISTRDQKVLNGGGKAAGK